MTTEQRITELENEIANLKIRLVQFTPVPIKLRMEDNVVRTVVILAQVPGAQSPFKIVRNGE